MRPSKPGGEQCAVYADRILQRAEMGRGVVRFVYRMDGNLAKRHSVPGRTHQRRHFIFVSVARNGQEELDVRTFERPQSGLRIRHPAS